MRILDSQFRTALRDSALLVDFQEQYILRRLESIREGTGATQAQDLSAVLFKTTTGRHQLSNQEIVHTDDTQMLKHATSNSSVSTITETVSSLGLDSDSGETEPVIRISEQSQEYSRFIPSDVPRLSLNFTK